MTAAKDTFMPDNEPNEPNDKPTNGVNRRQFLRGLGVAGAGTTLGAELLLPKEADAAPLGKAAETATLKKGFQNVTLNVNGKAMTMQVEPRTTLVNALRNHAEPPVTGPKLVCDQGACGACTVLVDGKTMYACMLLAVDVAGKQITTVEGMLTPSGQLSPVQQAFVEHDALMCGFCTPGLSRPSTRFCSTTRTRPARTCKKPARATSVAAERIRIFLKRPWLRRRKGRRFQVSGVREERLCSCQSLYGESISLTPDT